MSTTLKSLAAALAFLFAGAVLPAAAQIQQLQPDQGSRAGRATAQPAQAGRPSVGRISIPDPKAASLIQPQGQDWRNFHENKLPLIGGVAIIGMLIALVLFYLVRGRITIDHGFSGTTITRFASFDRFAHWLTAGCFIILALSGLNVSFGRMVILPLFGPELSPRSPGYGKVAHNFLAFPFMVGVASDVPPLGEGQHSQRARLAMDQAGRRASSRRASIRRPSVSTPARRSCSGS